MKNERGIGFVGLLEIALIVLKLCGIIKWSWLWVLSPIWISAVVLTAIIIISILLPRKEQGSTRKKFFRKKREKK